MSTDANTSTTAPTTGTTANAPVAIIIGPGVPNLDFLNLKLDVTPRKPKKISKVENITEIKAWCRDVGCNDNDHEHCYVYHCETGPAVFDGKGYERHYIRGKLSRIGGPAVIEPAYIDGKIKEEWWLDGERHRDLLNDPDYIDDETTPLESRPAFHHIDGTDWEKVWYTRGCQNRVGKPARITHFCGADDDSIGHEWIENDEFHRVGGPVQYIFDPPMPSDQMMLSDMTGLELGGPSYQYRGHELDVIRFPPDFIASWFASGRGYYGLKEYRLGNLKNYPIYAYEAVKDGLFNLFGVSDKLTVHQKR